MDWKGKGRGGGWNVSCASFSQLLLCMYTHEGKYDTSRKWLVRWGNIATSWRFAFFYTR